MKRYIALLLFSTLLWLTACSPSLPDQSEAATVPTSAPAQTESALSPETTAPGIETPIPEAPVELDVANYHYSLQQVGSFQTKDDLVFSDDLPLLTEKDENGNRLYTLLSHLGEDKMGKTFNNYDYFGNGIAATYLKGSEVPSCSLINIETGEVYLEDGAVQIEQLNERFYYVIYVTEKTENRDEAFIYFTDRMLSLAPDEGDILYKGYAKIYDLKKQEFVGNIEAELSKSNILTCGDTLCVGLSYGKYDVYLDDGTVLTDIPNLYAGLDGIIQRDGQDCIVYDLDMNEQFIVHNADPISLSDLSGYYSTDYFSFERDSYCKGIIDRNGTEIVPAEYKYISYKFDNFFIVKTQDEKYGVYQTDGTLVVPVEYDSIFDCDFPAFYMQKKQESEEKYLFIPGTGTINITGFNGVNSPYYQPVEDSYRDRNYLVYETGETMLIENYEDIFGAMVSSEYGIIELFHGSMLIEEEYSRVIGTKEYIYAYKDGMWTVYSWELILE